MSHIMITKYDSYDLDDYREAYRYLILECPNGLGAVGLEALNTMWEELNRRDILNMSIIEKLKKIAKGDNVNFSSKDASHILEIVNTTKHLINCLDGGFD